MVAKTAGPGDHLHLTAPVKPTAVMLNGGQELLRHQLPDPPSAHPKHRCRLGGRHPIRITWAAPGIQRGLLNPFEVEPGSLLSGGLWTAWTLRSLPLPAVTQDLVGLLSGDDRSATPDRATRLERHEPPRKSRNAHGETDTQRLGNRFGKVSPRLRVSSPPSASAKHGQCALEAGSLRSTNRQPTCMREGARQRSGQREHLATRALGEHAVAEGREDHRDRRSKPTAYIPAASSTTSNPPAAAMSAGAAVTARAPRIATAAIAPTENSTCSRSWS